MLNKTNEYQRGMLCAAATAALTHDSCIEELERQVKNLLRQPSTYELIGADSLHSAAFKHTHGVSYVSFWRHAARLVIFLCEGYMPNEK